MASLAHPGGNMTGVVLQQIDLTATRLQLLKEALPRATRVAVLWHTSAADQLKAAEAAARTLGLQLQSVELAESAVRTLKARSEAPGRTRPSETWHGQASDMLLLSTAACISWPSDADYPVSQAEMTRQPPA